MLARKFCCIFKNKKVFLNNIVCINEEEIIILRISYLFFVYVKLYLGQHCKGRRTVFCSPKCLILTFQTCIVISILIGHNIKTWEPKESPGKMHSDDR